MVRRRDRGFAPSCSCEVERGASALRRLVPHVGGIRSAERALGEGPKLLFMFVWLSSIRKFSVVPVHCRGAVRPAAHYGESPRPDLPSRVWAESICFCLAVARKKADHVFLMIERGLCPSRDPESCSRFSTIFEAPGPRLIKRWLPIASARRRTRVMTIFLRKCTTGGPQVDRSVDKLTAFVSGR
jgi:hypothetical protein